MANGNTFWGGFGTGAGGGPTPLTAGLMQLGQGMLAASTAPRAQRGALLAQAMNPQAMMQAKRRNDYYALLERMSNPVISEAPATAGGPQPALGGSLVDLPGGATEPGMVQTAMGQPGLMSPPAAPAMPPGPNLTPFQLDMLRAAGPEQGYGMLAQMMQPAKPQYMKGADGYLYNMATGQRALPGVEKAEEPTTLARQLGEAGVDLSTPAGRQTMLDILRKPETQINLSQAQTPVGKITQDVERGVLTFEEGERLKKKAQTYPQAQTDAASFANRMTRADAGIDQLMASGLDPAAARGNILAGVPFGNVMQSPEFQEYEQAKGDWIRAKLREESGAVINQSEFEDEERVYFPQIGDTPETIAKKAEARRVATQNLIKESQGAYEELYAPKQPPVPASDYRGQTVVSPDGDRWRSDGNKWERVQ